MLSASLRLQTERGARAAPSSGSILFQRGLYPAESFERVSAHGMTMLVASHPGLRAYLDAVLRQLTGQLARNSSHCCRRQRAVVQARTQMFDHACPAPRHAAWLLEGCLHKLVLVVAAVASREPLERWVFNVQREDDAPSGTGCARRA